MHISSSQNPLFCNFQPLHPTLSPAVGLVLGGCTLSILAQDIPRLYTLHPTLYARLRSAPHSTPKTHPKSVKNVVFTLFPCSVRKIFVSLRRESTPGCLR